MPWSWRICSPRGVRIYVHSTVVILLAAVAVYYWAAGHSVVQTFQGTAFVLAIFSCVVAHELGHVLMASRFGIRIHDITLLPMGSVTRMDGFVKKPVQELWIALAGPAVNVLIAATLFVWLKSGEDFTPLEQVTLVQGPLLERVMVVNLIGVIFNMLPAFPMDGGRALRAVLATRMEYTRATQFAARIGQVVAMLFGTLGLVLPNPLLLFIALFLRMRARPRDQEYSTGPSDPIS